MTAVEIGNVIIDGATVITDRATTVLEIPTASVVTMLAMATESETEGSTTPSSRRGASKSSRAAPLGKREGRAVR